MLLELVAPEQLWWSSGGKAAAACVLASNELGRQAERQKGREAEKQRGRNRKKGREAMSRTKRGRDKTMPRDA